VGGRQPSLSLLARRSPESDSLSAPAAATAIRL
jgi:hypothetical protein